MGVRGKHIGNDVLAKIGRLRYGDHLTRVQIQAVLFKEDGFEISDREVEYAFEWYGQLVSGAIFKDKTLLGELRSQGGVVLSLDGAEPMKGHEQVWLVRDTISGRTLRALSLRSTTAPDLQKLLEPVRDFLKREGLQVYGVISDAEKNIRKAVKKVFPGVRHQLCNLHYVQNLAEPLQKLDGKLRSNLRKPFRKLRQVERDIQKHARGSSERSIQVAKVLTNVCKIIQSILKDSAKPPFEPPGLRLYEKLVELGKTLQEMAKTESHFCLETLLELLSVVKGYAEDAKWIGDFYEDIRQVGRTLFADGRTLRDAKRMLRELKDAWKRELAGYQENGKNEQGQEILKSWLSTTKTYEPGLFHAFAEPRIPKTNNATESINKKLKTLERQISKSPRPGRRFTRNGPLNAIFINMKLTPGEAFIAQRRPEEWRMATQLLEAKAQSNGVARRARSDFKGSLGALEEDWHNIYTPTELRKTQADG